MSKLFWKKKSERISVKKTPRWASVRIPRKKCLNIYNGIPVENPRKMKKDFVEKFLKLKRNLLREKLSKEDFQKAITGELSKEIHVAITEKTHWWLHKGVPKLISRKKSKGNYKFFKENSWRIS